LSLYLFNPGGVKALGICRKIPLKERALGRGDAEICLDGEWWKDAPEPEQRALLDHELHHIEVKIIEGAMACDDLGRPLLKIRKHDYELGLFTIIAQRHGRHSSPNRITFCAPNPLRLPKHD